jgi:purine-nucleoside phosphorylase
LEVGLAIVLGSAFDSVRHALETDAELPFGQIPGMIPPSVPGHAGQLLSGRLGGTPVLILAGRLHYYEGHSLADVVFPMHVLADCGIKAVVLTNAAGGINPRLGPGDFMAIKDHLNLMGENPLRGRDIPAQNRFVDLSQVYDPGLLRLLRQAARHTGIRLRTGVYLAVSGPSFETPAEIRAFARLGADAVGMSTVPEAIAARQCELRVAGLSCIANRAAGLAKEPLSHDEVLRVASTEADAAARLLGECARRFGKANETGAAGRRAGGAGRGAKKAG